MSFWELFWAIAAASFLGTAVYHVLSLAIETMQATLAKARKEEAARRKSLTRPKKYEGRDQIGIGAQ